MFPDFPITSQQWPTASVALQWSNRFDYPGKTPVLYEGTISMSESKEIAPIKQEHCEHNLSVNIRLWHKCFMDLKKLFIIHMFMRRLDVSAIKTTGAFDTRTAFIYIHLFI